MKTELDELIEYYEMERDHLLAELRKSLEDYIPDYEMAEVQQNALWKVNRQLDTLYTLRDPLYPKKKDLLMSRENFVKMSHRHNEGYQQEVVAKRIREIDEQLEALNNKDPKPVFERQDLDELIYDLAENKIKGFRLSLKRKYNLYLELSRNDHGGLQISFPFEDEGGTIALYADELKKLGFMWNEDLNRLEFRYELNAFRNSVFLKTLIARIVFDVFHVPFVDSQTIIEIQPHIG